ncbi:HAD family hydrolase [Methanolapillus millepedarum]|uniref:Phosphoglycolate phosphatase n=1 Tax=Methanolapillus millepedarum TaxID=3028296 RepID=A0AA96V179_9EURY|nr:Phosphoglycolate phosphatase [Methanosarcinaceae archaeon Ac7]
MEQEINCVFSDMDNTLFDFYHAKLEACSAVVNNIGAGDPEEMLSYFLRGIYGFENLENIEDYLREKYVFSDDLFSDCCQIYEETKIDNILLYDGVAETIESLKKMECAFVVVTDANTENATKRLRKAGIYDLVDGIFAHDMSGKKKPDLGVFEYALNKTSRQANESIFIGDSLRRDIAPAKKIGMLTAYAAYGDRNTHEREFRFNPDYRLNNISEMVDIVQSKKSRRPI